ncbi:hypothetical protein DRJ54_03510 [Candidatus Acetothermia bacterium]|nr:MAG: hypothetical protein DRJ54_03510 [Candidatus Acetothermia bacterium]
MAKWGILSLLAFSLGGLALAQADLSDFPSGTTYMAWRLSGGDLPSPQTLRLEVTGLEDGRYRVLLSVEAEGTPEELGMLGFLGSAAFVQSSGADVDFAALLTLIKRREKLEVGKEYALPGGVIFQVQEETEIAGVTCLIGDYRTEDGHRVELGLALSDPVYFVPLLKVYEEGGVSFEMLLTEYRRP